MFHIQLKKLRENKGMTQKQLAEELKISRSSLSAYETGAREPDFSILKDIATYFNVTIDYMLGYNLETPASKKDNNIYDEIERLNDASKKELKKYVELLRVNEVYSNKKNSKCDYRRNIVN